MRTMLIAAAAAVCLPVPGYAQDILPSAIVTLPIKPENIGSYCLYANRIYSPGAQLCVEVVRPGGPAQAALVCKLPATVGATATWDATGTLVCVTPRGQ